MVDTIFSILPIVFNVIFCILSSLYLSGTFAQERERRYIQVLSIISGSIVLSIGLILVQKGIVKILACVLSTFLFSFVYKQKIFMRLLLSAIFISLITVADIVSLIIISTLFSLSTEETLNEPFNILGIIMMFSIVLFFLFILRHTRKFIMTGKFDKRWLLLYSLPLASTFVIFMEYAVFCEYETTSALRLNIFISDLFLIAANFIIFTLADALFYQLENENKLQVANQLIEQQSYQYKKLLKSSDNIRQYSHDMKNFILGALSDLEDDKIELVKESLTKQLESINAFSKYASSKNVMNTILAYKSEEALKSGVKVVYEIKVHENYSFDDIDLAIMIGNLIDNAVEACQKLRDDKKKEVSVFIEYINNGIYISISNPVSENVDTDNLTTTKKDKKNHGLGLISVKNIVNKYNGDIVFSCENLVFEVSIALYNNDANYVM